MSIGKCRPQPNNMFYHCGLCCAEIKCTDKSCPWVTACKREDYRNCEHYVKPTDYRSNEVRRKMGRLTIEKDVKEMGMYELAHNSCYAKDGVARYRDFETDIDCRDLARKLMVDYGLWKGIPEHGLDADNELVDDDIFDESILENLWYGLDTLEGLIALFYRNLWAMADLRTKLKNYEDLEEQGRLIEQKHGTWIPNKHMTRTPTAENYHCSECTQTGKTTAYCPNCGAKMDEVE